MIQSKTVPCIEWKFQKLAFLEKIIICNSQLKGTTNVLSPSLCLDISIYIYVFIILGLYIWLNIWEFHLDRNYEQWCSTFTKASIDLKLIKMRFDSGSYRMSVYRLSILKASLVEHYWREGPKKALDDFHIFKIERTVPKGINQIGGSSSSKINILNGVSIFPFVIRDLASPK